MTLIFATNNQHKADEAKALLCGQFDIITPSFLGYEGDIPETHDTIVGNSVQKAQFIWDRFGKECFADDTGLEVDALGGAPGVYSARYAGDQKSPADNRARLLKELQGVPYEKRTARFRCVVTLIENGAVKSFEGVCEGRIALEESKGIHGFGYDVLFIPEGYSVTMAELTTEQKNAISHRGKAMRQLLCHLQSNHA